MYTGKTDKENLVYFKDAVASTKIRMEPNNTMTLWLAHSSNEKQLAVLLEKLKKKAMKKYCQDGGSRKLPMCVWPEMDNVPVLATGKRPPKRQRLMLPSTGLITGKVPVRAKTLKQRTKCRQTQMLTLKVVLFA